MPPLLLWILVMVVACSTAAPTAPCPCAAAALCRPVTKRHEREVFGFSVSSDTPYDSYDWTQLTTVAWNEDPELLCMAHAADARVVADARGASPRAVFTNATARAEWLAAAVAHALAHHLDGINFDLEDALTPSEAASYTALVREAAAAFHAALPGSQVSVDVPWSPHDVDGRAYDWAGLAAAADLLFVMAYDMQSQIWGRCVASANSPLALARRGLQQWLAVGAPRDKLVLGLPWYGYLYPCTNPAYRTGKERELCALPAVGFAGAPCSDAAGRQVCYSDVLAMVRRGGDGSGDGGRGLRAVGQRQQQLQQQRGAEEQVCEAPRFDETQDSPYARCRSAVAAAPPHYTHQLWFDDPVSLRRKAALVEQLGLRGVGVWNLDCLDYGADPRRAAESAAMWAALRG